MLEQLPDHMLRLYRFALHLCGNQHLAEDLTQETMLRAVRNRNQLKDPGALKVWLLQILKNLWIDRCRVSIHQSTEMIDDQMSISSQPGPFEHVSQAEEVAFTVAAMKELPERQRSVLHLIACEQLSVSEVADVLQISHEAVRSSLSVARARMRQRLQSRDIQPERGTMQSEEHNS